MPVTSSPPYEGRSALDAGPPEADGPGPDRLPEVAWVLSFVVCLTIMVTTPRWAEAACYLVWASFALLYGFRVWACRPALQLVAVVAAGTGAACVIDVARGLAPTACLVRVPLLTAVSCVLLWQVHRGQAADQARSSVSAHTERLLAAQRQFLVDASHQLKTPITVALGHAELLAGELAGRAGTRDIEVVVGELNRLRRLSERLLLIAASENPDFLRPEPVALALLAADLLQRWRPAAARRWRIGQLDDAVVDADPDRLALALDALLENAVQHTSEEDVIRVSVVGDQRARFACVVIEDSGTGIPREDLARIFDRFRSGGAAAGRRGTGLGLPLAQAVARGHGGEIRVHSELGEGSRFEVVLPAPVPRPGGQAADELGLAPVAGRPASQGVPR